MREVYTAKDTEKERIVGNKMTSNVNEYLTYELVPPMGLEGVYKNE